MKVKCIKTKGSDLPSSVLKIGHLRTAKYNFGLGDELLVYGIASWDGVIRYLTMDNTSIPLPIWSPADLFEIIDFKIPPDWYFKFFGHDKQGVTALWGYYEMVFDENHYDDLIEREAEAIKVFENQKQIIDNWHNTRQ
jgi:hypothetical protein